MLKDQRILITGANGGIGLSICETLLQNGARLVLLYHKKMKTKIIVLGKEQAKSILGGPTLINRDTGEPTCIRNGFKVYC